MISKDYGRTKTLLLTMLAILLSSFTLKAGAPERPIFIAMNYSSFDKSLYVETNIPGKDVNVDGFRLYVNYPWQSDPSFSLFEDVPSNDSLMKHYENMFAFILWKDLKEGEYKFFLTAYNSDGESASSDTITLRIGGGENPSDFVMIFADSLYSGEAIAYLGKQFRTQLSATSYSGREVNFSLENGPEGMTIGAETGIIEWIPAEAGEFDFSVRAFVKEEPEIFADFWWRIKVSKCSEPSYIKGIVKDKETGGPIMNGYVTLVQTGKDSIDFYYGKAWGFISNGEFSIEVDEGTFYLMAQGEFNPVWYENAQDITAATPIQIKCGETANITMEVEKFKEYPRFTVSGNVTDKDGAPFIYSYVEFFSVDDGGKYGVVQSISCDPNGFYKIELSSEYKYIARAFGFNDPPNDTIFDPYNYTPMYYNQVTNPNEATVLVMDKDYTDINFMLGEGEEYENTLSGYLKNENGEKINNGFVVAYLVNSDLDYLGELYFGKFAQTNNDGKFEFKNLIPGDYVLLGMPMSADYMPGFYVEGKTATWLWEEATRVKVESNGDYSNIDIILPEMVKIGGIKGIHGIVVAEGGMIGKSADKPMGQQPVSGAIVYAVDKNNIKVKYDVTDQDGKFELNGLNEGQYKLYVDKVGFKYSTETVILDKDDMVNETNLVLLGQKTGVDDNNSNKGSLAVSPIPASDFVSFTMPSLTGLVTIKIYDTKGNVVMTYVNHYENGTSTLHIDVSALNAGNYYAGIFNGTLNYNIPFVIVR